MTIDIWQDTEFRAGVEGWKVWFACGHVKCHSEGPKRWIEKTATVDQIDQLAMNAWNDRVDAQP